MLRVTGPKVSLLCFISVFAGVCGGGAPCLSGEAADAVGTNLVDMPLSHLVSVRVTSVSRKQEAIEETSSAVFVVTSEDIRRSGATSIPDALRMVPGVEVVQVDDNDWYVAVRGFNGELGNKLLVLIDGRTIYSPVFSGVFWYEQDVLMDEIDRIEVVRGPGAAMWGANAVNGVINISTRAAKDQQGGRVTLAGGTLERAIVSMRYGFEAGDDGYAAVWAKAFERDQLDRDRNDSGVLPRNWESVLVGFRYDWDPPTPSAFSLHGSWRRVEADDAFTAYSLSEPYSEVVGYRREGTLFHLLGKYSHRFSATSDASVQMYADSDENDYGNGHLKYRTFDIDTQYRRPLGEKHDIVCGAGYRFIDDHYDPDPDYAITFFSNDHNEQHLVTLFAADEIELVEDRLSLQLESKLEHNDYTGWEVQPSVRFRSDPAKGQTFWGAVSRAVRTPARLDDDSYGSLVTAPSALSGALGSFGLPLVWVINEGDLDSEEVIACELGYRFYASRRLSWDVALYFNQYDDLRVYREVSDVTLSDSGDALVYEIVPDNGKDGYTWGGELSATWRVTDAWSLIGAYSHLDIDLELEEDAFDFAGLTTVEGYSPRHQASLRSQWNPLPDVACDVWLRYVDELEALGVDAYTTFDIHLAWQLSRDIELSLVGRNLAEEWHREFSSYEVERSVYAKLVYDF